MDEVSSPAHSPGSLALPACLLLLHLLRLRSVCLPLVGKNTQFSCFSYVVLVLVTCLPVLPVPLCQAKLKERAAAKEAERAEREARDREREEVWCEARLT